MRLSAGDCSNSVKNGAREENLMRLFKSRKTAALSAGAILQSMGRSFSVAVVWYLFNVRDARSGIYPEKLTERQFYSGWPETRNISFLYNRIIKSAFHHGKRFRYETCSPGMKSIFYAHFCQLRHEMNPDGL